MRTMFFLLLGVFVIFVATMVYYQRRRFCRGRGVVRCRCCACFVWSGLPYHMRPRVCVCVCVYVLLVRERRDTNASPPQLPPRRQAAV